MASIEDHAKAVLEKMVQEAEKDTWRGRATTLVASVTSVSYYSKIMTILEDSGAIKQVKRGGGNTLSEYLIMDPGATLTGIVSRDSGKVRLKKYTSLEDRVAAIEAQLSGFNLREILFNVVTDLQTIKKTLGLAEANEPTDDGEGKAP